MKIIAAILIAMIFTLVWLLKFEWYFNIWVVNLIWYDDTFDANLGFLESSTDLVYYFPDLIFEKKQEFLTNFLSVDKKQAYLILVNLFFLIISWFIIYILRYFPKRNDRIYLVLWIIISYLLIADFMM